MTRSDQVELLESVVSASAGPIAKAYLQAIAALKQQLPIDDLIALIAAGDVAGMMQLLDSLIIESSFGAFIVAINDGVAGGGHAAASIASSIYRQHLPTGIEVAFNVFNLRSSSAMQAYAVTLVREVTAQQRAMVRDVIERGLRAGTNPRRLAVKVREHVGLTIRQSTMVDRFRAELETFHLKRSAKRWRLGGKISRAPGGEQVFDNLAGVPTDGILHRRLRDFRFDRTLIRAMRTSKPISIDKIDRMVTRYAERMLRHRATVIARSESLRAAHVGSQSLWRQAVDDGNVDPASIRREWIYTTDNRTRDHHRTIPGLNAGGVGLEQAFETSLGPLMYPGDHLGTGANTVNCRCTVVYSVGESRAT